MTTLLSIAAAFTLALAASTASAHPGDTDANGCHTVKATGEYHCHKPRKATLKAVKEAKPSKTPSAAH